MAYAEKSSLELDSLDLLVLKSVLKELNAEENAVLTAKLESGSYRGSDFTDSEWAMLGILLRKVGQRVYISGSFIQAPNSELCEPAMGIKESSLFGRAGTL